MTTSLAAPEPQLELNSVSFFGRTFQEYSRFFSLDPALLKGKQLLDVAAGPSSFTAEANAAGIDVVAADPLYGSGPEILEQHVMLDYRAMFAQMRAKPQLFRPGYFANIDEAETSRRKAARKFLTDYGSHFVQGRYVGASLPRLPFEDGRFDLVLCAHLLFVYAKILDFDFHVAACAELVRVSRGEVRIHPLVGAGGQPYPMMDELEHVLRLRGIESERVALDYEFFSGSGSMLVLRRS